MGRQDLEGEPQVLDKTNSGIQKGKRRLSAESTHSPHQIEQHQGDNVEWDVEGHSRHRFDDAREHLSFSLQNRQWSSASSACSTEISDISKIVHQAKESTVSASFDPAWDKYTIVGIHALLENGKRRYLKAKLDEVCVLPMLNERVVNALSLTVWEAPETVIFQPVTGPSVMSCKQARLSFKILPGEKEYTVEFWIVPEDKMFGDMLLGLKFLFRTGLNRGGKIWMEAVDAEWNA